MEQYKRILVVDNEPEFAESLRMTLTAKSHRVVKARTSAEAKAIVSKEPFDALVLGTITPRGDAFAFHQWLRQNPRTREMPFLVNTTWSSLSVLYRIRYCRNLLCV